MDLGSGNGTYLNGRRVVQPTRLRGGDKIEIGGFELQFREAESHGQPVPALIAENRSEEKTLQHIKSSECWLLVADMSRPVVHRMISRTLRL